MKVGSAAMYLAFFLVTPVFLRAEEELHRLLARWWGSLRQQLRGISDVHWLDVCRERGGKSASSAF